VPFNERQSFFGRCSNATIAARLFKETLEGRACPSAFAKQENVDRQESLSQGAAFRTWLRLFCSAYNTILAWTYNNRNRILNL